jgi:acyl-CoA dehydrogenase
MRNFPNRAVGWVLKFLLQPFGVICREPADRLVQAASNAISEPTAARERLSEGIYVADGTELGRLDRAFRLMVELEPLKQEMRKARIRDVAEAEAKGVLSGNEAARMREAQGLVREVVRVDDFAPEEITNRARSVGEPRAAA